MQETPLCPKGTRGIGGLFARQLEHASLPGSALINCGLFSPDVRVWFGSGFGWKTNGDHYGKGTRAVAVAVSKSCHYGHDKDGNYVRFTEPPKISHSIRKIPVPKQLVPILRTLKKNGHSEFVIAEDGRAIAVRSYQRSFELLQKKLNIKRRGFMPSAIHFQPEQSNAGWMSKHCLRYWGTRILPSP